MPYVLAVPVNQRVIATADGQVAELRADALATHAAAAGLEEDLRRRRRQGATPLPLGPGRDPAAGRHRQLLAAGPPQPDRPDRPGLLPVLRPRTHPAARAGPRRRRPLGDRGDLPDRQGPGRPGPVPGPPLRRLVPTHHPGHARPRLPDRHHRRHKKGAPRRRTHPADRPRGPTPTRPPDLAPATRHHDRPELVAMATTTPSPGPPPPLHPEAPHHKCGCSTRCSSLDAFPRPDSAAPAAVGRETALLALDGGVAFGVWPSAMMAGPRLTPIPFS